MSKDKKKRDKEDELYLAGLKERVRIQEILWRLRASSVEADLATEAVDHMISDAVLDLRAALEKGLKAIKESNDEAKEAIDAQLKAQDDQQKWNTRIGALISILLTIIAVFVGIQSLGS